MALTVGDEYVLKEGFGVGIGALPEGTIVTVESDDEPDHVVTVSLPGLGGSPVQRRVTFARETFDLKFEKTGK